MIDKVILILLWIVVAGFTYRSGDTNNMLLCVVGVLLLIFLYMK